MFSDGDPLRFRGEVYHPYHFSCTGCKEELTATARCLYLLIVCIICKAFSVPANINLPTPRPILFQSLVIVCTVHIREVRTRPGYTANELNELYCLRCHDKMGIPICGACR